MSTLGPMTISLKKCGYCGSYHDGTCPRVKSIEYHPSGAVKRVEFHPPTPPTLGGSSG